jgi:hypothetical protein
MFIELICLKEQLNIFFKKRKKKQKLIVA